MFLWRKGNKHVKPTKLAFTCSFTDVLERFNTFHTIIVTKTVYFQVYSQNTHTHTKWKVTLTSHWKGFSPVWVLMCSSSPRFWLKALWHSLHLYGFSCSNTHIHILRFNSDSWHTLSAAHPWFDHIWKKPGGEDTEACKYLRNTHTLSIWCLFLTLQACSKCQFKKI